MSHYLKFLKICPGILLHSWRSGVTTSLDGSVSLFCCCFLIRCCSLLFITGESCSRWISAAGGPVFFPIDRLSSLFSMLFSFLFSFVSLFNSDLFDFDRSPSGRSSLLVSCFLFLVSP